MTDDATGSCLLITVKKYVFWCDYFCKAHVSEGLNRYTKFQSGVY